MEKIIIICHLLLIEGKIVLILALLVMNLFELFG